MPASATGTGNSDGSFQLALGALQQPRPREHRRDQHQRSGEARDSGTGSRTCLAEASVHNDQGQRTDESDCRRHGLTSPPGGQIGLAANSSRNAATDQGHLPEEKHRFRRGVGSRASCDHSSMPIAAINSRSPAVYAIWATLRRNSASMRRSNRYRDVADDHGGRHEAPGSEGGVEDGPERHRCAGAVPTASLPMARASTAPAATCTRALR